MPAPPAYTPLPLSRGVKDRRSMRAHRVRPRPSGLATYRTAVLADGPIGYWRLDETTGTTAVDQRGLNNGTYSVGVGSAGIASTVPLISWDSDPAVAFSSSQYVDCGNPAAFQLTAGSIECWVETSQAPDANYHAIMTKEGAFGAYLLGSTGTLGVFDFNASLNRDTGISISDGKPHHLVVTFQNGVAGGTSIYLDGSLVLTTTITVLNQLLSLRVANNSGNASQALPGMFDEAAIYDYTLSSGQVANHYLIGRGVVNNTDAGSGTLVFGGQVPVEISSLTLPTPQYGRQMPLRRGVRDRRAMFRYARFSSFTPVPLFQDSATGTLIFGGARADAWTGVNAQTGMLILGGQVPVEISGLILPTPAHGRVMPLKRGVRDRRAMFRYVRFGSFKPAPIFLDSQTGTLIFAGTSVPLTIETDAQTGILIIGGTAVEFIGTVIVPPEPRSSLAWIDYGAIREPF